MQAVWSNRLQSPESLPFGAGKSKGGDLMEKEYSSESFVCSYCDRAFPMDKYFGCPECGRKSDYIKQWAENEGVEVVK
jgi:hypothetical protein